LLVRTKKESLARKFDIRYQQQVIRDNHYPVCRLDIRQDSEFATGCGYPKTAFKWEPDTDLDIRNDFIDISRISDSDEDSMSLKKISSN